MMFSSAMREMGQRVPQSLDKIKWNIKEHEFQKRANLVKIALRASKRLSRKTNLKKKVITHLQSLIQEPSKIRQAMSKIKQKLKAKNILESKIEIQRSEPGRTVTVFEEAPGATYSLSMSYSF